MGKRSEGGDDRVGNGLASFDHFLGPYFLVFFCNSLYLFAKNDASLSSPLEISIHLRTEREELLVCQLPVAREVKPATETDHLFFYYINSLT